MKKNSKQRLFEMMGKVDSSFKKKLNEDFEGNIDATRYKEIVKPIKTKEAELQAELDKLSALDLPDSLKWNLQEIQMELDTVSEKLYHRDMSPDMEKNIKRIYEWLLGIENKFNVFNEKLNHLAHEGDEENLGQELGDDMNEMNSIADEESEVSLNENNSKSPINKFVYFSFNYPPNFIDEVWSDDPGMANHLKSKFGNIYNKTGPRGVMGTFYVELDSTNQKKLEDWIINNYNH